MLRRWLLIPSVLLVACGALYDADELSSGSGGGKDATAGAAPDGGSAGTATGGGSGGVVSGGGGVTTGGAGGATGGAGATGGVGGIGGTGATGGATGGGGAGGTGGACGAIGNTCCTSGAECVPQNAVCCPGESQQCGPADCSNPGSCVCLFCCARCKPPNMPNQWYGPLASNPGDCFPTAKAYCEAKGANWQYVANEWSASCQ